MPSLPTSLPTAVTQSTLGKKYVMAASGLALFGFSLIHMLGNLQIFVGRETINGYHVKLYGLPALLWGARLALLAAAIAHVTTATQLWARNRRARPQRYAQSERVITSYAARTMIVSGVLLLVYLLHHVAHMTGGATAGLGYRHDHVDVYANLLASYRVPWMAAASVVATLVYGTHVYHGSWSLFQSLGVSQRRHNARLRSAAMTIALIITAGYIAVPVAVFFRFVE